MPGADTILVFRTSRARGSRAGLATAAGVVTGPVVWGTLSGIGVALVIAHNGTLYATLALAGALYLLYLAAGCFRAAATGSTALLDAEPLPYTRPCNAYITGLLTNLLNPKIGVFYLSVMPGLFQGRPGPWVGGSLGLIQAGLGITFLSAVALLAGRARHLLASRHAAMVVESVAGACLLTFAAYVTWSVFHR
jgi:threonine/homoserine/homoserine lactone efflux protein